MWDFNVRRGPRLSLRLPTAGSIPRSRTAATPARVGIRTITKPLISSSTARMSRTSSSAPADGNPGAYYDPTGTANDWRFQYGDVIPLSWNVNNKDLFLKRLAPRLSGGDPATDPEAFANATYFNDNRVASETYLRVKDLTQKPLIPNGSTPLGNTSRASATGTKAARRVPAHATARPAGTTCRGKRFFVGVPEEVHHLPHRRRSDLQQRPLRLRRRPRRHRRRRRRRLDLRRRLRRSDRNQHPQLHGGERRHRPPDSSAEQTGPDRCLDRHPVPGARRGLRVAHGRRARCKPTPPTRSSFRASRPSPTKDSGRAGWTPSSSRCLSMTRGGLIAPLSAMPLQRRAVPLGRRRRSVGLLRRLRHLQPAGPAAPGAEHRRRRCRCQSSLRRRRAATRHGRERASGGLYAVQRARKPQAVLISGHQLPEVPDLWTGMGINYIVGNTASETAADDRANAIIVRTCSRRKARSRLPTRLCPAIPSPRR